MFRRRGAGSDPAAAEPDLDGTRGGKGKPTPKRSQAEAARKQRLTPPKTRKEASALRRERVSKQRQDMRQAMRTGDDRGLPARDRGKAKRLARDYVDSRRTIGEFLIPIVAFAFFLGLVRNPLAVYLSQVLLLGTALTAAVSSWLMVRQFRRLLAERFPDEPTKGIGAYIVMRSWQMRRLRLPKAQVKVGTKV
jgi:Protein of unknown function (DUF3043)